MIKIFNGYEGVEVELLSYTKDIDNIAVRMCGLTYHHKDDFSNYKNTVDFITKKLIENKTSPKIMEAAHCVFAFKNISRVNLARLTRDQVGAINSESGAVPFHNLETGTFTGKYKKEVSVIKPLSVKNNEILNKKFDEIINKIDEFKDLIEKDEIVWAPDMRYLFPQGETISIAMEYNARQLSAACNKRMLNAVGDEDNFTMRKAILALKNRLKSDFEKKQISELSYKIWCNIVNNSLPKVQFIDELLGEQLCEGMKTRGDCNKPIYDKTDCSLFYELINAYVYNQDLLLLDGEKNMVEKWIKENKIAQEYYKNLINSKSKNSKFCYVIQQIYNNNDNKYVASCCLADGTWRTTNINDARKFNTMHEAKNFIENKYKYGGNFVIKQVEC